MTRQFYVEIGETAEFSKTLTEADLAMFCAISGDFDPIHVDEEHARHTVFGQRIAHGILSMALLSTVSGMISRRAVERGSRCTLWRSPGAPWPMRPVPWASPPRGSRRQSPESTCDKSTQSTTHYDPRRLFLGKVTARGTVSSIGNSHGGDT